MTFKTLNRIDSAFSGSKDILNVYFTAGYPALEDTVSIAKSLQDGGVDMIEIGIPFSDPVADGPTIQESSMTAWPIEDVAKRSHSTCAVNGVHKSNPAVWNGSILCRLRGCGN